MREGEIRIRRFVESTVLPLAAPYSSQGQPVNHFMLDTAPKVLLVTHALLTKCLFRNLFELSNTGITWRHNLVETGVRYLSVIAPKLTSLILAFTHLHPPPPPHSPLSPHHLHICSEFLYADGEWSLERWNDATHLWDLEDTRSSA